MTILEKMQSMINEAKHELSFVSDEKFEKRISTCLQCEHYFSSLGGRCKVCGCVLNIKAKIELFNCPKGKWTDK